MKKLSRMMATAVVTAAGVVTVGSSVTASADPLDAAKLTAPAFHPNFIHNPSCEWISNGGHSAVVDLQPALRSTIRVMEPTEAGNLIGPVNAKRQTSPTAFDEPKLLQVTLDKGETARFELTWVPNYDEHGRQRTLDGMKLLVVQQKDGNEWKSAFETFVTLPSARQCMWSTAGK